MKYLRRVLKRCNGESACYLLTVICFVSGGKQEGVWRRVHGGLTWLGTRKRYVTFPPLLTPRDNEFFYRTVAICLSLLMRTFSAERNEARSHRSRAKMWVTRVVSNFARPKDFIGCHLQMAKLRRRRLTSTLSGPRRAWGCPSPADWAPRLLRATMRASSYQGSPKEGPPTWRNCGWVLVSNLKLKSSPKNDDAKT